MLKRCGIVLVFVLAGGMMTARAQTDDPAAASPIVGQNAPDELNLDLQAMGPWPLEQDYLNTAGLSNQDYLTATGQTVPRQAFRQP